MGAIGGFSYPDFGIDTAVEVIETIIQEKVEKIETLAAKLGHDNASSGSFRAKLTACQRYGLLVGKSTSLSVSSLGKRLVHPKGEQERTEVMAQAVLNVDLFRRLFEKVGTTPPSDDFWVTLADIVEAERDEIMDKASRVEGIYREAIPVLARYERLRERQREAEVTEAEARPQPTRLPTPSPDENTILLVSPSDDLELKFPRKEGSIDILINTLGMIKKTLQGGDEGNNE